MNKIVRGLVTGLVTAIFLFALPGSGIVGAEEVLPEEPLVPGSLRAPAPTLS